MDTSLTPTIRHVAIAILHRPNQFLLQLRDDPPAAIIFPGLWGLFGGHMEGNETPLEAVQRELQEEIGYTPPGLALFNAYCSETVVRNVFHAPLEVSLESLVLGEGQAMALLTVADIQQGEAYAEVLQQTRAIGQPHRQILLDFIATGKHTAS